MGVELGMEEFFVSEKSKKELFAVLPFPLLSSLQILPSQ